MGKISLSVLLVVACATCVRAAEGKWIVDAGGCKIWDSTPQPNESVTWTGPCKNGHANGKGVLVWYVNGRPYETYDGELTMGHYYGCGKQVWSSGSSYEGCYQNDRAHGQGTFRGTNGQVYSGNWVNGCFRQGDRRYAIGTPLDQCP